MINFKELYPNYDVDKNGIVYKQGQIIKPFKSNKYLQVLLFDKDGNRNVCGVHSVVAMKYLDYYPGCVVHHKDEDPHNNKLENLEILSREEHSRMHGKNNEKLRLLHLGKDAWNKGLKMPKKFREHCSISAKKRWEREKQKKDQKDQSDIV